LIISTEGFIHHFPPMGAVGALQQPQHDPLLSGPLAGGQGVGEGDGGQSCL